MTYGMAFFAGSIALPPAAGPFIDAYTSSLFSACWISQILSAYTGPAIQVRRSSDNATQDINFVSGVIDTTSLSAFVGSNSAYVSIFYDQTGNGNHFEQATAAKQPRIVNAGTYDGKLVYNGSGDFLQCINNHGTPAGTSIYMKGKLNATGVYQVLAGSDAGSSSNGSVSWDFDNTNNGCRNILATSSGSNLVFSTYVGASPNNNVNTLVNDFSQSSNTNRLQYYVAGASQTNSISTAGSIPTTTTLGAAQWIIGANTSGGNSANMNQNGFIIYEAAHNSTTVSSITTVLNSH